MVVLLHGVSSCPRAFVDFAPMLLARGHNVVALRMPENGYADRATDALRRLTAEQLARLGRHWRSTSRPGSATRWWCSASRPEAWSRPGARRTGRR